MFTFGDTFRGAVGVDLDESQVHMAARMVWDRRHGFGQLRLSRSECLNTICRKEKFAFDYVRACRSDERVNIAGIGGERAVEKAASLRDIIGGYTLIEPSRTLKIAVHRVGVRRVFRAPRLGAYEPRVERIGEPRHGLVLHIEQVGERLVEPLCPEMVARFGVDELDIDPHAISAPLDATFEDVADVQFTADLLQIDVLAFISEGGVAPDHDGVPYPWQVGREALRDPVDEMLMGRVAAEIGEGQDDDREA